MSVLNFEVVSAQERSIEHFQLGGWLIPLGRLISSLGRQILGERIPIKSK